MILEDEDQVIEFFKQFHAIVERETVKKLKCLCSDNRDEYDSREFDVYRFTAVDMASDMKRRFNALHSTKEWQRE